MYNFFLSLFCILFFLSLSSQNSNNTEERGKLPKGDRISNLLFYLQRSINISTINYVLNTDEKGNLDIIDPIKVYWKNYASDGSIESLNYIQKKYAYGIEVKIIDAEKKSYCFNFVSYRKKKLYLIKSAIDNKYHVFCEINNKMTILNAIFIQIEGGSFWFPKIKYIEISGRNFSEKEDVIERIIP